jgi:hypothetical protein
MEKLHLSWCTHGVGLIRDNCGNDVNPKWRSSLSRRILFLLGVCGVLSAAGWGQSPPSKFNFNAGFGFGLGKGDVGNFTGTSYDAVVGGGLNLNRFLGVKAEYMFYNLSFQDSVKLNQDLQGAGGNIQSLSLNPTANFSLGGRWGVYGIGGFGIYRRNVSAPSKFLAEGTVCQPAWIWWQIKCNSNNLVSPQQTLSSRSAYAGGYNFGGGITYRLPNFHGVKLYAEGRYHHAYTGGSEPTSIFPVVFGVRW